MAWQLSSWRCSPVRIPHPEPSGSRWATPPSLSGFGAIPPSRHSYRVGHYEKMNIALRVRTTLLHGRLDGASEPSPLSTDAEVRERWKAPVRVTPPQQGDRSEDADYVAQSRWRNQPATVSKPEKSNLQRSKVRPQCISAEALIAA